jgi:hypothetical protein
MLHDKLLLEHVGIDATACLGAAPVSADMALVWLEHFSLSKVQMLGNNFILASLGAKLQVPWLAVVVYMH